MSDMNDIALVHPSQINVEAAEDYLAEHRRYGISHLNGCGGLADAASYEEWVAGILREEATGTPRPGLVRATTFFGVRQSDGRLVGMINIRHTLDEYLAKFGGHIGYGVRPTERRKGYATRMLALALDYCRDLGMNRVLVTCDRGNAASAKTIINNGGILEDEVFEDGRGWVQRYWIDLVAGSDDRIGR